MGKLTKTRNTKFSTKNKYSKKKLQFGSSYLPDIYNPNLELGTGYYNSTNLWRPHQNNYNTGYYNSNNLWRPHQNNENTGYYNSTNLWRPHQNNYNTGYYNSTNLWRPHQNNYNTGYYNSTNLWRPNQNNENNENNYQNQNQNNKNNNLLENNINIINLPTILNNWPFNIIIEELFLNNPDKKSKTSKINDNGVTILYSKLYLRIYLNVGSELMIRCENDDDRLIITEVFWTETAIIDNIKRAKTNSIRIREKIISKIPSSSEIIYGLYILNYLITNDINPYKIKFNVEDISFPKKIMFKNIINPITSRVLSNIRDEIYEYNRKILYPITEVEHNGPAHKFQCNICINKKGKPISLTSTNKKEIHERETKHIHELYNLKDTLTNIELFTTDKTLIKDTRRIINGFKIDGIKENDSLYIYYNYIKDILCTPLGKVAYKVSRLFNLIPDKIQTEFNFSGLILTPSLTLINTSYTEDYNIIITNLENDILRPKCDVRLKKYEN
jgi:hypothetical protein